MKKNNKKNSVKRKVDFLADELTHWQDKNFILVYKKNIATWKGALILSFVAGIAAALVWGAKMNIYDSSSAAANSTLYFSQGAAVDTTDGSTFNLTSTINTGTNAVSIVALRVTFDATKLTLNSITKGSTFSSVEAVAAINNTNGTGTMDLSVGNANPSVTGTYAVATFSFTAKATGNASVAFTGAAGTSGAAADNESGNVVTTWTPTVVTINVNDITAPSGGSITYSNAYVTTASVALTVADGTDSQTGIDTLSRVVQRKRAALSAGSCGTYSSWSNISPTGPYPNFTDTTVSSGYCYQYQYLVSDNASNQATFVSSNVVKVDTAAPASGSVSYSNGYYTNTSIALTSSDGTDSVSGINTSSRTVQRRNATLSSGNCGTYGSWATISLTGTYPSLTDTAISSGNCYQYRYLISDNAGNQGTFTNSNSAKIDTTAPDGGSIDYTDGFNNTHTIAITAADGTNSVSGIDISSSEIERRSATISSGNCGTYGSWSNISPTGTYPNFIDSTIVTGNCYQYRYKISNNAGTETTYTLSDTVKSSYFSDINLDGQSNYLDYGVLHTNYGNEICGNVADMNADCIVNYLDYGILHDEYGSSLL